LYAYLFRRVETVLDILVLDRVIFASIEHDFRAGPKKLFGRKPHCPATGLRRSSALSIGSEVKSHNCFLTNIHEFDVEDARRRFGDAAY
jgi:hypothetical protein